MEAETITTNCSRDKSTHFNFVPSRSIHKAFVTQANETK